jgi:hypothetical protein
MIARFHRAAERELAAAMEVGEERGTGLGDDLLDEVERVVALLCEFPDLGERLDDKRRRFPESIQNGFDRSPASGRRLRAVQNSLDLDGTYTPP